MNYLDHLTSSQQAIALGRTLEETLELLTHARTSDENERRELSEQRDSLHSAGYGTRDFDRRIAALTRSIRSTAHAQRAVRQAIREREDVAA